jgi:hypothetical protein
MEHYAGALFGKNIFHKRDYQLLAHRSKGFPFER